MRSQNLTRNSLMVVMTVVMISIFGVAQNAQKEGLWQKIKNSAKQTGQNAAQQGTQQVQQGAQQVQQGAQQMQQQVQQQIPGGGQMNAVPQTPCGSLTGANGGGNLTNAAYTGSTGSCGPQCFNAGPFAAAITQMTMSQQSGWHVVRMNIQFKNLTDQPLIIAYREGSMVMVDNLGNAYQPAGGYAGAVQGIGIDRGNQTDSQFQLGPGQTGNAMFAVARVKGNQSALANGYTYNFTVDELQAQNGAEAIAVRQYNLNFSDLAPGASSAGFGGAGTAPSAAPVSNVAGTGRGSAATGSSYVGGNAAAPAVGAPGQVGAAQNAVGGSPTAIAPNGKGAAIGRRAAVQPGPAVQPRVAVQPGMTAPGPRTAVPAATTTMAVPQRPVNPVTPGTAATVAAPRAINNAAMRSNPAIAAKPAAAAKPIPNRAPAKKTTTATTPPLSR